MSTDRWRPARSRARPGGTLRHGFIPFRRPVGTGSEKQIETYQGSIDTLILEGKLRKVISMGSYAGGSFGVTGGAYYSRFNVETDS